MAKKKAVAKKTARSPARAVKTAPARKAAPARSKKKVAPPEPLRLGVASGVPSQPTPIVALAVSADGRWAATGDGLGAVRLCDLATGQWVGVRRRPPAIPARKALNGVRELALARDGSALAARIGEHLWIIDRETFCDSVGSGAVFVDFGDDDLVFAPDCKTLLARNVHGLCRWDLDGQRLTTPKVEGYPFQCMTPTPDGSRLVLASCLDSTGDDRSALIVLDAATGAELERVSVRPPLYQSQVGVRPDGEVVVVVGFAEQLVLRWRPGTREVTEARLVYPACAEAGERRSARFVCGPASLIAVRTERGEALVDATTFEVRAELQGTWHHVAATPDGAKVLIADGVALDVRGASLAPGGSGGGLTSPVGAVAFEPDGAAVWTGDDAALRRFALPGGAQTAVLDAGGRVCALSPDARLALVRRRDDSGVLALPAGAPLGHAFPGTGRDLARDGGLVLAISARDQPERLVSTADGSERTLPGSERHHYGLALSPSGRLVAGAQWEHELAVWNAATGAVAGRFRLPGRTPMTIAFSPDERWLALGACERAVRLVACPSGKPGPVLEGHTKQPVRGVAFSPDGSRLATTDGKDTRVWRLPAGEPAGVWKVGGEALAWSADGARLAVGGPGAAWVVEVV